MRLIKKRIVVTGGTGRFGKELKKIKNKYNLIFPSKKELNILKINSIHNYIKLKKPKYLLHLAGLSRPMEIHKKNINKSIDLNIIGTANITKVCADLGVKLIYFSTSYVYPGTKGNYKETDPVLPWNNYSWSKLGGECSVNMYSNSLILRMSMTEEPFIHDKAFADFTTNFIFYKDVLKFLFKLIDKKGIINVGGKTQSVYSFIKKYKPKIKRNYAKKLFRKNHPLNPSINTNKLIKILK